MSEPDRDPVVRRNRSRQIGWYGEPLGPRFRRLLERLGVSQAGLAQTLGLSAPMLSQLMSGQRAKISNPTVLARFLQLESLAADPRFTDASAEQRQARLAEVRASSPTTSDLQGPGALPPSEPEPAAGPAPTDPVAAVRALLLSVATPAELETAATRLQDTHPGLAEVLRVYGTGEEATARAHYARVLGDVRR